MQKMLFELSPLEGAVHNNNVYSGESLCAFACVTGWVCVLEGECRGQALEKNYDGVRIGNIKSPKEENYTWNGKD